MFGISWAEFFVILLVAVVVIPARNWPDVARAAARAVKTVRALIWKITDASEQITRQIELEQPINELIGQTTDDVLNQISVPRKRVAARPRRGAVKRTGARKK